MNRTLYYYLFGKFRSRLTSAENAIANKADSSDLSTLSATVESLTDRIASIEQDIANFGSDADSIIGSEALQSFVNSANSIIGE